MQRGALAALHRHCIVAQVNIDAALVKTAGTRAMGVKESMVEMQNGCICCTLREDLLKEVLFMHRFFPPFLFVNCHPGPRTGRQRAFRLHHNREHRHQRAAAGATSAAYFTCVLCEHEPLGC